MGLSIGIVILFQRRHYKHGLDRIADRFDMHVAHEDDAIEISASGAPDEPMIRLAIEDKPERLNAMIAKVSRLASEAMQPAIARCDAMLVAYWDRRHDVADLSLEVSYLESMLKGIQYYANIDEISEGSFPPDAAVPALVPIDDEALARRMHGSWRLDPDTPCHVAKPATTALTITASGDLVYSMVVDGSTQRMLLTYKVENGDLVTDQPSKPNEQRSPIALGDDRLYLRDLGGPCTFVRDADPLDPDAALAALVGFALRHGCASAIAGGAMSPFVVFENPSGERVFMRFADATPDSQRARQAAEAAVRGAREVNAVVHYAFATDAILTIGGERVEAIVVEGGRLGRGSAMMAAMKYVDAGDGRARPEGVQIALPDVPNGWL